MYEGLIVIFCFLNVYVISTVINAAKIVKIFKLEILREKAY